MQTEQINGIECLKLLFERTLENKEKKLRTVLSGKPLVYLLGDEFSEYYMKERTKRDIYLRSLRFSNNELDKPDHKDYNKFKKEVRLAPKEIEIKESIIIWDDNVAIFNTENKTGLIIKNREHAFSMKSWFDYIWFQSK